MNKLLPKILAQEIKIEFYKKKVMLHKSYFSQLDWKNCTVFNLIIPVWIGMRIGQSNIKITKGISKYFQMIVWTIISHFETKCITTAYFHLEEFIKNKLGSVNKSL
jgi:hypothetical protein